MNIFDFAMQMESDAVVYYRGLADRCGDKGLATILNLLADAEVVHEKILGEMREKTPPDAAQTDLLSDVKNIFAEMQTTSGEFNFDVSEVELYRSALNNEKKSEKFYREKALEAKSESERGIFERIAKEEREHCLVLQNIIDFMSEPETWLENAEWSHMEAY